MISTGLISCVESSKSKPDAIDINKLDSKENIKLKEQPTNHDDKYLHTKYEYNDTFGKKLIIENSLPKGGLKYTSPNGKNYVYAIFWTRITNETANPFEFSMDFPAESIKLPSSTDNNFKIYLPADKMTLDKKPLFDYGFTSLESFLDRELYKSSSMQGTINPKDSKMFYVIILFDHGVDGVMRAGFSLKGENLHYIINDKEIQCGQTDFNK